MRRSVVLLLFPLLLLVAASVASAAAPVIEVMNVCRGADHHSVWVRVSDTDGAGDIASVTITDAAGVPHTKTSDCGCWWPQDEFAIECGWCEWGLLNPPAAGSYEIVAADAEGNPDGLITPATPEVPEAAPELVDPAYRTSTYQTIPTFSWTDGGLGADYFTLDLWEGNGDFYWHYEPGSATSVVYNSDGTALQEELTRTRVYGWEISAWKCEDCGVTDPRVYIYTWQRTYGLFRVSSLLEPPPAVPIEGKLLVTGDRGTYYMEGDSQNITWLPTFTGARLSPLGDKILYNDDWSSARESGEGDQWTADLDGSNPVNLTHLAGLGGINCMGQWSSDASKIVFMHCDPEAGKLHCEAGFHIWVVNADGTGAHRVTPEGNLSTWVPSWAPNGYRILCVEYSVDAGGIVEGDTISIDEDGTDRLVLPDVGLEAVFSPDGSRIVSHGMWRDVVDGEPGYWRTMELCNGDGTNPQVLLERFVSDAEINQHFDHIGWVENVWAVAYELGPQIFTWAPKGDRIAFTDIWPFDPLGALYWHQEDIWLYNLGTGQLTRLTDDPSAEGASWSGNNTFPDDLEVTVDNATVTFAEATGDGLTTIIRDDDPPSLPTGYQFCGEYYDISTTAPISGIITIQMHYEDADVPGGNEQALSLLHWDGAQWVNITTGIDTVNNVITGECYSLSEFGIAFGPQFLGLLAPVNNDGSSIFKLKSTVSVKFQLRNPDGSFVADAVATLYVAKVTDQVDGTYQEAVSTAAADSGNTFRYDPEANQYVFNLGTKSMSTGAYSLRVEVNGLVTKEVLISLK